MRYPMVPNTFLRFTKKRYQVLRSLRVVVLGVVFITLCACSTKQQQSSFPVDYRNRHPIALVNKDRSIDIFVSTPRGLDTRQQRDLREFASDYRRGAKSNIVMKVPGDAKKPFSPEMKSTLRATWQTLASTGVRRGTVSVQYYQNQSGYDVSLPIQLSFTRLGAEVVRGCGQWPEDLAGGDSLDSWENRQYWNFGCSSQQILAAQVADPVDLVRGRQEERIDTVKRMTGVAKLRKGEDPSTQYSVKAKTISSAAGD